MPERPEDAFDQNFNAAVIRDALPVKDELHQQLVETIKEQCGADEMQAILAIDVALRFVLFHQIPPHALYAHNKQKLEVF